MWIICNCTKKDHMVNTELIQDFFIEKTVRKAAIPKYHKDGEIVFTDDGEYSIDKPAEFWYQPSFHFVNSDESHYLADRFTEGSKARVVLLSILKSIEKGKLVHQVQD